MMEITPYETTDFERQALAHAAGPGWHDGTDKITETWEAEQYGRLKEAMESLRRFGWVEATWEQVAGRKPGIYAYHYRLLMEGRTALDQIQPRSQIYRCCDRVVVLNCVCVIKTFCPDHGGGCHGSHD